jgi:hypothetical protein
MCPRSAVAAAVSLVLFCAGPARPEGAAPGKRVRIGPRYSAGTVERALAGARRRLERPGCQRLFSEFADGEGRPLADVLEAKGTTGRDHLGSLIFYDGTDQAPCERDGTLAFTWPGSPVVFVCSVRFTRAAHNSPTLAEAALIHEGLHALGLGENPPTSSAITSRVLSRCGG